MEKPEYVYWMPTNEPSFVLPYQHQFQIAAVIKAVKNQKMDKDIYFSLLSDRVQHLIEEYADPQDAIHYAFYILDDASLLYEQPDDVETAGNSFILENYRLREHLHLAGTFEAMPEELNENDSEAELLFNETDLESWLNAITTTLPEDHR